jgi:hypothetical protein
MKLRLIGQRNQLGGGTHFGELCDALKKIAFYSGLIEELDCFDKPAMEAAAAASGAQDVTIWFWNSEWITRFQGNHVVWGIFESDRLPQTYCDYLRAHGKRVWVPSHWGRDVLVNNGIASSLIDVVPEGVNGDRYHPHLRRAVNRTGQPFRFLSVGKFEKRKGYEELLEGFRQSFANTNEVELLLKADYFIDFDAKKAALTALVDSMGLKNVRLFWGQWSAEQLLALYNYADAFVFASRAEGWGLPALEAAATGLPLVSTYYSGHTEFLRHCERSLIKIAHRLEPIKDPDFAKYWPSADGNLGQWAQPSATSIAAGLTLMRQNHELYRVEAQANSLRLIEKFSWSQSAHCALECLSAHGLLQTGYAIHAT